MRKSSPAKDRKRAVQRAQASKRARLRDEAQKTEQRLEAERKRSLAWWQLSAPWFSAERYRLQTQAWRDDDFMDAYQQILPHVRLKEPA